MTVPKETGMIEMIVRVCRTDSPRLDSDAMDEGEPNNPVNIPAADAVVLLETPTVGV